FQVQHKLVFIDGNASHSENCFKFTILYAAVFVNQYGPESNGAMSCIFGMSLYTQGGGSGGKSHQGLVFGLIGAGVALDEFGLVFKGVLSDGLVVAVKRILEYDFQGDVEFCNEVEIISNLKHRNLVPLRGCCVVDDDDEKFNAGEARGKEEASVRHMTNEEDIQREPMVVAWDPAVVQTTVDNRNDKQGRDRVVNSSIILNEWHYKISNRLSINGNQGELNGRADSKGSCESKDSKEMVSNYYEGYECHKFENVRKDNGLEERRPNIAKKRQDDGLMVIDNRSGRKEKGLDKRRPTMDEKRQDDGLMVMDSRCGPAGGYPKRAGSDPVAMLARNEEKSTRIPTVSTAQLGEDAGWPNRSDAGQHSVSETSELSERPTGHGRKPTVLRSVAGDMEGAAGKSGMADESGRRRSGDQEAESREKEDRWTGVERPTIEEVTYASSDRRLKGKEVELNAAPEAAPRTRTARNGGNRIDAVKPRSNDPEVKSQFRGDIGSRLEEGEFLVDVTAESKGKGREEEHENDADSGSEAGMLDSKEHKLTWDEEMAENKEAWKLAVES
ncbi:hypothetical protein S245_049500, partial [Arachis hypogaea]